jgi:amino acid adenylation domain-containing protein
MTTATTVVGGVLRHAAATEHATAIVDPSGERLTYGELAKLSARVAHVLRARGAAPGRIVGLEAERTAQGLAAMLGIMRTGAGCLPLNADAPTSRLRAILATAKPDVVLTAEHGGRLEQLCDATPIATALDHAGASDADGSQADSAAYVLFTSGSTGVPKGVVMPHRSLARLVEWHLTEGSERSAAAVTSQLAPWTFDVSFQEIFATLCSGGTLMILEDAARRSSELLIARLRHAAVRRLFLPTALLQPLAESGLRDPGGLELEEVIVAGSALRLSPTIRSWFSDMPGATLHNHYGPTETHVVVAQRLDGAPAAWPDVPPIGLPLPHVRAVVELRGDGGEGSEIGELLVGGDCLATGYLGDAALTRTRFVEDADGARWFRTGDLVSRDGDVLHFHGRGDRQVKVRGFRVDLTEVEAVLVGAAGVADCAIVPDDLGSASERLIAYVVPSDPPVERCGARRVAGTAWSEHVADVLPDYMLPSVWVEVASLPMTRNGKVDHGALPEPPGARPSSSTPFEPGRDGLEALICRHFEHFLGVAPVGANDSFLSLGGTSLAATQLAGRLAAETGQRIGVEDVLAGRTPRGIAARVGSRTPGDRRERRSAAPGALSRAQHRFLVAELLDPGAPANIVVSAHRLRPAPSTPALRAAVEDVCARHPILLARFDLAAGRRIDGRWEPEMFEDRDVVEAPSLDLPLALAEAEQQRPFDLGRQAARFTLARLPDGTGVLTLAAHHIVIDGWSEIVLLKDLSIAYNARLEGGAPRWPDEAAPLDAFISEEVEWLGSSDAASQREWWPPFVAEIEDLPWPALLDTDEYATAAVTTGMPTATTTAAVVHMTALGRALQETGVRGNIGIGLVVAGRSDPRFTATVGPLLNTVCVPIDLRGGAPRPDQVERDVFAALAHSRLPFDEVVTALRRRPTLRHPLCQALLIPQSYDHAQLAFAGSVGERLPVAPDPRPFPLVVTTSRVPAGFDVRVDLAGPGKPQRAADEIARRWREHAEAGD